MSKESLVLQRYPENAENAQFEAAKKLICLLDKSLNYGNQVLLLLSGGTWIPALDKSDYSILAANPNIRLLTLTALDERNEIGTNNNFAKLISSPFVDFLIKSGAQQISTMPYDGENVGVFGNRINDSLKKYLALNTKAILIATAGVGGESNVPGHIAGIEPMEDQKEFSKNFLDPDVLYRGYVAKKLQPELRATATFSLLDKINCFVLLVLNPEQKRKSLDLILSDTSVKLNDAPCVYFRNRPNVTIFTDISE